MMQKIVAKVLLVMLLAFFVTTLFQIMLSTTTEPISMLAFMGCLLAIRWSVLELIK